MLAIRLYVLAGFILLCMPGNWRVLPVTVTFEHLASFTLVVGVFILLNVWLLRGVFQKFPKHAVPWVAVGIGLLVTLCLAFIVGHSWEVSLIAGLGSGFMSVAQWELFFKHLLP